jgi:hypothetical protein
MTSESQGLPSNPVKTTERLSGPAGSEIDQVGLSFDWLPNPQDGLIVFQVRITRSAQISRADFEIDLRKLSHDELEQLNAFLERRHAGLMSGYEMTRRITWLLDISLCQQQPNLSKLDRDAKVKVILLAQTRTTPDEQAPRAGK